MKELILNRIYGFLYREYDGLHNNVYTDGYNIWIDINDETYSVTVNKCEKENEDAT